MPRQTTEHFVTKARNVHGDKYDYSLVEYVTTQTKVLIICREHGPFSQTPTNHMRGHGCPNCSGNSRPSTEQFIIKARKVHGDKYDYSSVAYTSVHQKIVITCPRHGPFLQDPNSHLRGSNCSKCAGVGLSNTEDFITKARRIHGDYYDYSAVVYVKALDYVTIICPEHGLYEQTASGHLRGYGCVQCVKKGYSQKSLRWLRQLSETQNINIHHAENGGEFRIPGTKIRVDGYCKETNTIYEFHGDAWHGNPLRYQADSRCHPLDDTKTAAELYQKTLNREEKSVLLVTILLLFGNQILIRFNAEKDN